MLNLRDNPYYDDLWKTVLSLHNAGAAAQAFVLAERDYLENPGLHTAEYGWAWQLGEFCRFEEAKRVLDRVKPDEDNMITWRSVHIGHLITWSRAARRPQEALALCEQLFELDPQYRFKALLLKAEFCTDLGDLPAAERALLAALELEPNKYRICYELGMHYRRLMELELAADWMQKALDLEPDEYDERILEDLEDAIALRAELQGAAFSKAWMDEIYRLNDADEHVQAMVYVLAYCAEKRNFLGRIWLAKLWHELGNYTASKEALKDCDRSPCKHEDCESLLAMQWFDVHESTYEDAAALAAIDRAIEILPNSTTPRIFKGGFLGRIGRLEEAVACHQKATQCEGNVDEAWLNIALIRRAQMRFPEAKSAVQMALSITPDYDAATRFLEDLTAAMRMNNEQ